MDTTKAAVHVLGTLTRRVWFGCELQNTIVIRPAGAQRDTVAYVVNQVKFDGPSEMLFETQAKQRGQDGTLEAGERGFEGRLPGFGGAVLVYTESDENTIQVQPNPGDAYVKFQDFKTLVASGQISVLTLNPTQSSPC